MGLKLNEHTESLVPSVRSNEVGFADYFKKVNTKQFDDLVFEYQRLEEWANLTFPEVEFRFEFNSDEIHRCLNVKTTILTSNELNPNNRLFKTSTLTIPEASWYDAVEMSKILKSVQAANRQVWSKIINDFYNKSKEENALII